METGPYMAAELFKMMGGVDMVHVPYRAEAQMLTDLLGGQVQVAFGGISSSVEHIRAGKLRALAVTTTVRLEAFPDTPTVGESVPGYEATDWCGVVAPKDTPLRDHRQAQQGDQYGARGSQAWRRLPRWV
jgi:tripartite-type tricarboxylate transporter receptor subunit TctC